MNKIKKTFTRLITTLNCLRFNFYKSKPKQENYLVHRKAFVGFWPWPRAFATQEASNLAKGLRKLNNIYLNEALSDNQAKVFREVAAEYITHDFEIQLCADGLLLYRCNDIEDQIINAQNISARVDDIGAINARQLASSNGYKHYIAALNILFLLLESELHNNGRNNFLYWIKPITRIDLIRQKYHQEGSPPSSITVFGPQDEMLLQRFKCKRAIGARLDGMYQADLIPAFTDATLLFESAYRNHQLWDFLLVYSNAWTNLLIELEESSLTLSWSLIERDLLYQVSQLISRIAVGSLNKMTSAGNIVSLNSNAENDIRTKIAAGESLMAGTMIGILQAYGITLSANLNSVKSARNAHQHSGATVTFIDCKLALEICNEICSRRFSLNLNNKLIPNPHLGISA